MLQCVDENLLRGVSLRSNRGGGLRAGLERIRLLHIALHSAISSTIILPILCAIQIAILIALEIRLQSNTLSIVLSTHSTR